MVAQRLAGDGECRVALHLRGPSRRRGGGLTHPFWEILRATPRPSAAHGTEIATWRVRHRGAAMPARASFPPSLPIDGPQKARRDGILDRGGAMALGVAALLALAMLRARRAQEANAAGARTCASTATSWPRSSGTSPAACCPRRRRPRSGSRSPAACWRPTARPARRWSVAASGGGPRVAVLAVGISVIAGAGASLSAAGRTGLSGPAAGQPAVMADARAGKPPLAGRGGGRGGGAGRLDRPASRPPARGVDGAVAHGPGRPTRRPDGPYPSGPQRGVAWATSPPLTGPRRG